MINMDSLNEFMYIKYSSILVQQMSPDGIDVTNLNQVVFMFNNMTCQSTSLQY